MPFYDYRCGKCGDFEVRQSMSEDHLQTCPNCEGKDIVRLVGGTSAIHFKGAGFFVNDYKKIDSNIKKYMPDSP